MDATAFVAIENVTNFAPAGTVTEAGIAVTALLVFAIVNVIPPAGAGRESMTAAGTRVPPLTPLGPEVAKEKFGQIPSEAVCRTPLTCAPIVALTVPATPVVVMLKIAAFAPSGSTTLPG